MEKIKVNMSPNPLDVQTIHASQNDGEARQWEFELHNNGELIDTSEITEQLFFKAYKGGTEQILPENTSTPTTSPFIGDIKYPQGLLSDQEFLYRESPTEEDGYAKITDIKGNTIVWNQLVQNGNFADTSNWIEANATFTVNNNIATMVASATYGNIEQILSVKANHMYFATCDIKLTTVTNFDLIQFRPYVGVSIPCASTTGWQTLSGLFIPTADATVYYPRITDVRASGWDAIQIRNCMVVDLTQMGLDSVTAEEFTSLFPLPYYAYNQGTLLSFMGNGIKTVSKNQFDTQVVTTSYQGLTLTKTQGTIRAVYSGGSQYAGFNFYGSPVFTDTFLKGRYRLSFDVSGLDTQWTVGLRQGASFLGGGQAIAISNDGHYSFTIDAEANPNCYLSFARTGNKTTAFDITFSNIQLELGTTETPYTPFEEKTISLPISQYFPDGMKSAMEAYDELSPNKAITRIGAVDLGTLNWYYTSGGQGRFATGGISSTVKPVSSNTQISNIKCTKYSTISARSVYSGNIGIAIDTSGSIWVYDTTYGTDASAFRTAMNGVYLYYELATPLENYGVVDMGSLDWERRATTTSGTTIYRFTSSVEGLKLGLVRSVQMICKPYRNINNRASLQTTWDKVIYNDQNTTTIFVSDNDFTDATAFKQAMQGVYLLYEKENPQGFTTASLVTENAEIPLSNNDGVLIGKCTEELSAEPGFHDAKIKLSDGDGDVYSNKLQLHVERSPQ